MPLARLARFILLPELSLIRHYQDGLASSVYEVSKDRPDLEICPRCAKAATAYYDRRTVVVRDEPIRSNRAKLVIHKHRWWCPTCKKPFTEPVDGILPRRKTTQRFRKAILTACNKFSDLSAVRQTYKCSTSLVYTILYEQLELKWREYQYEWPKRIGMDEHFFRRYMGHTEFGTLFTDLKNRRAKEICHGKSVNQLEEQLKDKQGRENVRVVCMDMCEGFRRFCWNHFPNAEIVVDKFHVLKLLSGPIFKELKLITGKNVKRVGKKHLLTPSWKLDYFERKALWAKLEDFPKLKELYWWKERLHRFYKIKGTHRAQHALEYTIQLMRESQVTEVKRTARTLSRWKTEITNYFTFRVTNALTEGLNNIAKLVQRRAFGYKSFRNYRLRVLNACA
jgi:transposase